MARTVEEIKAETAEVEAQVRNASDALSEAKAEFHLLVVRREDLVKELLTVLEEQAEEDGAAVAHHALTGD